LRYVLRAQRDRYLPLKVIKDELARIDAGLDAGLGDSADGHEPARDGTQDAAAAEATASAGGLRPLGRGVGATGAAPARRLADRGAAVGGGARDGERARRRSADSA
jgi:hypothetical protein